MFSRPPSRFVFAVVVSLKEIWIPSAAGVKDSGADVAGEGEARGVVSSTEAISLLRAS